MSHSSQLRPGVKGWNKTEIPGAVKERAATKVVRSSAGCWISTYSVASHGYAQIGWGIRGSVPRKTAMVLAHRASWEHFNGPVPRGMTLDHVCKERRCVNPDHLRVMDNFENGRRTKGRDWALGECANGHPNSMLVEVPWFRSKSGKRRTGLRCPACRGIYAGRSAWKKSNPGEPFPDHLMLASER